MGLTTATWLLLGQELFTISQIREGTQRRITTVCRNNNEWLLKNNSKNLSGTSAEKDIELAINNHRSNNLAETQSS